MNARFYAPGSRAGDLVALPEEEAAHLARVLRLAAGAPVVVFDGQGREFDARVERAGKSGVTVRVGCERAPAAREPRVAVTLAQAVLKGDKMDDVVRDAVMMGVAAVLPVVSARAEVTLQSLRGSARRERWRRIAISSAKQCGRAVVPPVLEPVAFADATAAPAAARLMFVEPNAAAGAVPLGALAAGAPDTATILVGPEGGWTAEEVESASGAARLLTLGTRTFRADAMAIIAIAALFAVWKEF